MDRIYLFSFTATLMAVKKMTYSGWYGRRLKSKHPSLF